MNSEQDLNLLKKQLTDFITWLGENRPYHLGTLSLDMTDYIARVKAEMKIDCPIGKFDSETCFMKNNKDECEGCPQLVEWIKFSDQYPVEPKKIVARHLTTPDIIGEAHYFNPESDNARRANLYAFEWRYIE